MASTAKRNHFFLNSFKTAVFVIKLRVGLVCSGLISSSLPCLRLLCRFSRGLTPMDRDKPATGTSIISHLSMSRTRRADPRSPVPVPARPHMAITQSPRRVYCRYTVLESLKFVRYVTCKSMERGASRAKYQIRQPMLHAVCGARLSSSPVRKRCPSSPHHLGGANAEWPSSEARQGPPHRCHTGLPLPSLQL